MHAPVGAPATWVLSNHDVIRHVTRYGRADTSFNLDYRQFGAPTDLALGTRRARAGVMLLLALPGSAYIYQGEELGLEEVEDIPDELRQDPMFFQTQRREPRPGRLPGAAAVVRRRGRRSGSARDAARPSRGCRSRRTGGTCTVAAETGDPDSMLELYRTGAVLPTRTTRRSATGR